MRPDWRAVGVHSPFSLLPYIDSIQGFPGMLIPHTSPPRGRKTRINKGAFRLLVLAFVPSMWYNFSCGIVLIPHLLRGFDYGGNHSQSLFLLPFFRHFIFRREGATAQQSSFFQVRAAVRVHAEIDRPARAVFQVFAPIAPGTMAYNVP